MSHQSMPARRAAGAGLLSAFGLLALAGAGHTQNIASGNAASIFAGKTVGVSSTFPASQFAAGNVVDGTAQNFVFNDGQATEYLNISGFTVASGNAITSLRFFDEPGYYNRTSPSVTIYASATGVTVLNPAATGYTTIGTFALPYGANTGSQTPDDYQTATTPASTSPNNLGGTIYYDTLTGLNIPAGTKSLLFSFAQNPNFVGGPGGTSLSEIQGFVTPAPEPSQTAVLGLGMLALAGLSLKARRRGLRV